MKYVLKIRRPAGLYRYTCETIREARNEYCRLRDESGEGASTFNEGIIEHERDKYRVSYNGRIWNGDDLIFEEKENT